MKHSAPDSFLLALVGLGVLLAAGVALYVTAFGPARYPVPPEWWVEGGDAARGPALIEAYGCGSCHRVPGVRHADGRVGPSLDALRGQQYIAGQLPNAPEALVYWIMHPQRVAPGTAMPDLGVSETEARDIAAYLYAVGE